MAMITGTGKIAPAAHAHDRPFIGGCVLIFLAAASGTVAWCESMAGGMPMPGGWTMSMAWMRMPGQTWAGAAGTFSLMWTLMMVAMMLPSLLSMLSAYRRALRADDATRCDILCIIAAAAYFTVWTAFGAAGYPFGAVVAAAAMRWPAVASLVPFATGLMITLAGCIQLTTWKRRQLACCRAEHPVRPRAANVRTAWRQGLQLGIRCVACCSGFMLALLGAGVMDVGSMAVVGTGITAERLAPHPERIARAAGALLVAVGAFAAARALIGA